MANSFFVLGGPKLSSFASNELPMVRYTQFMQALKEYQFAENIHGDVGLVVGPPEKNWYLPISIHSAKQPKTECYLTAATNQYIGYTKQEILNSNKYGKWSKLGVKWGANLVEGIMNWAQFNKAVYVNSAWISTNLWPKTNPNYLPQLVETLQQEFPNHNLVFRSINAQTEGDLLQKLQEMNAYAICCRQMYMLNPANKNHLKKRPFQQDLKRWQKETDLHFEKISADSLTETELQQLIDFYKAIYIEKYSELNPKYTTRFLKAVLDSNVYDVYVLKSATQLEAVQIICEQNGVITTPFIGYNPNSSYPHLYKYLAVQLVEEAEKRNAILNMSSGAASFKKQRGGEPCFEYNVVIPAKKAGFSKLIWKAFAWFSKNYTEPYMIQYEV